MSSKENDFFGIEYTPYDPDKKPADDVKVSQSMPSKKPSGTEFLDTAFFPELSQAETKEEDIQEERRYIDKDDAFGDYFKTKNADNIQQVPSQSSQPKGKVHVIETPDIIFEERSGFQKILQLIDPVWKYSDKQIVDMLANRIVYNDEELIAFDKPYQLAYSGAVKNAVQMDQVLQNLKQAVAPNIDRLHLVKSLDKACSGVILFAKSAEVQKKYHEMLKNNRINCDYRTIVKNVPKVREAEIKVPLRRFLKGQDYELRPLLSATKEKVFYPVTSYKVKESNNHHHTAYLGVTVQNEIPHQIRSHLGYGIGCPILGDLKYTRIGENINQNLSNGILASLELTKKQSKKLPMFLHLREVRIPVNPSGSKYVSIKAYLPEFFQFALKRLSLLRK